MSINYLALIIAAIIPMIVGFIWYGPLFGKQWMKLAGVTKKDMEAKKSEMPKTYGIMLVASLVMAYVLSQFVTTGGAISGAMVGFWIWLGFVVTVKLTDVLFNGNPKQLFYIDISYRLVSLVLMGAVLGAMR